MSLEPALQVDLLPAVLDGGDFAQFERTMLAKVALALAVPNDVVVLTAGVDIARDRVEYEIIGWTWP